MHRVTPKLMVEGSPKVELEKIKKIVQEIKSDLDGAVDMLSIQDGRLEREPGGLDTLHSANDALRKLLKRYEDL